MSKKGWAYTLEGGWGGKGSLYSIPGAHHFGAIKQRVTKLRVNK